MTRIAIIGQKAGSTRAAKQLDLEAELLHFNHLTEVLESLASNQADYALIPVYNTREGGVKEYFRLAGLAQTNIYWVDNIVLPIHLSLGVITAKHHSGGRKIRTLLGRDSAFKQGDEYLEQNFPDITKVSVTNIEEAIIDAVLRGQAQTAVIGSEKMLKKHGLKIIEREIADHNRTRFAVLGKKIPARTGYDSTAIITRPLSDRVGLLVDILNEFTRRGISILDLRSENDIRTQKLQVYIEAEGHIEDINIQKAIDTIEKKVVQEHDCLKLLGSFPRVDMRVKQIKSFGFIGTGAMSRWFAKRLENEGYTTILTGRNSRISPQEMISEVQAVLICVPISATTAIIKKFGPLLKDGQALILLAGESEITINTALEVTSQGVEIMLVHNLWGPQAATMKDKNVSVVKTSRSGVFCSEFEAFLYKHGAEIYHDSPRKHDLLMGISQKLPTMISAALAKTLSQHNIDCDDLASHTTLTSLYGILAMVRVHNQNPRTYAEIMSTSGEGRMIVRSFVKNIISLMELAEDGEIDQLCRIMDGSKDFMSREFIETSMNQARSVDEILSDSLAKTYP
ncbi:MAG: prephenate dehydratase [Deltaproteobacteria bacterium]|nr:MAG: prephenate dehydratase [Deltaproteobacteria bacterium]